MASQESLGRLEIRGFRGFKSLTAANLTRVNLFVGANNTGKTSILEAVEMAARGSVRGMLRGPTRRDERIALPRRDDRSGPFFESSRTLAELDLSQLFHGRQLRPYSSFSVFLEASGEVRSVECAVVEMPSESTLEPTETTIPAEHDGPALGIEFMTNAQRPQRFELSPYGGVATDIGRRIAPNAPEPSDAVHFLGTDTIDAVHLAFLWDRIVLTPEEQRVTDALRIIEPTLERIAFLSEAGRRYQNIVVKLAESERRIPLGSLGDGVRRLLVLALHLIPAQNGFLMVDEIDTGLHYSVMSDMWRLVIEIARRLRVQVMATTHSLDCVRALAWVRQQHPDYEGEATVHRLERGAEHTISYTLQEIALAAHHHIEVR